MARTLVALAILVFAAGQAVAFTDCCCQSLCRNPNEVCTEHDHGPRTAKEDCCSGAPAPAEAASPCTHLAPSHEILPDLQPLDPGIPAPPILPEEPSGPAAPDAPHPAAGPDPASRGSPPLHLRHHVLLI
jgi:hypothetical protein